MNKMSEEARQTRGINLSIDTEEPTPFKTKHAACIAKILGSIDKVVEYVTEFGKTLRMGFFLKLSLMYG